MAPVVAAVVAAARRKRRGSGGAAADGTGIDASKFAPKPEDTFWSRLALACRQREVRELYHNARMQLFIAALIMGNFVTNLVEKQIDPTGTLHERSWFVVEFVWNTIFIVELIFHAWGEFYVTHWDGHFLRSGWNLFDVLVVSVSIPSMTGQDTGSLSYLRMMRAFRVFRLFKRIKSLNRIIVSLASAVPGLVNAAFVMIIFMCIYGILAVDLFREFGHDGTYLNVWNETVKLETTRGLTYGDEYFGNFGKSMYTLFQVLTGESWSEAVARPIVLSKNLSTIGVLFYCSFIIICGIVLINVAVAVLLEKMVDNETHSEQVSPVDREAISRDLFEKLDVSGDGRLQLVEFLEICSNNVTLEVRNKMLPILFNQIDASMASSQLQHPTYDLGVEDFTAWLCGVCTTDFTDKEFLETVDAMQRTAMEDALNAQCAAYVEQERNSFKARGSSKLNASMRMSGLGRFTKFGDSPDSRGSRSPERDDGSDASFVKDQRIAEVMSKLASVSQELSQTRADANSQNERLMTAMLSLTSTVASMQERVTSLHEHIERQARMRLRKARPDGSQPPPRQRPDGARPRPQAPPDASMQQSGSANGAGAAAASGTREDRLQDGERTISRSPAGRAVSRSGAPAAVDGDLNA